MNKLFLLLVIVLVSCSPSTQTNSATPSQVATHQPAAPTQAPTATPSIFVREGTPLPDMQGEISVENVKDLQILARWGYGDIEDWSLVSNDSIFLVHTSIAIYGYEAGTLNELWRYDPGVAILSMAGVSDLDDVVVGQADGKIVVLNALDGSITKEWRAESGKVEAVDLSSDGSLVASVGEELVAKLWQLSSGEELWNYVFENPASPGVNFVSSDSELAVQIWNYETGYEQMLLDVTTGRPTGSILENPGTPLDGDIFLQEDETGLSFVDPDGNTVQEFEAVDPEILRWGVLSSDLSEDGSLLAAGFEQGMVAVWQVETGKLLGVLGAEEGTNLQKFPGFAKPLFRSGPGPGGVYSIDITSDNKFLVSTDGYGEVTIWNLASMQVSNTAKLRASFTFLSPDEQTLISIGFNELSIISFPALKRIDALSGGPRGLIFSPNGDHLASGSNIWDTDTGLPTELPYGESVRRFSQDGATIFTIQPEWTLRGRRLSDLSIVREITPEFPVEPDENWDDYIPYQWYEMSWSLSPDAKILFGSAYDTPLMAWDATNGEYIFNIPLIQNFDYSPDSRYLAVSWGEGITIYAIEDGLPEEEFQVRTSGYENGWLFSTDSQELWVLDTTGLQVFDVTSGERLLKQQFDHQVEPTGLIDMNANESLIVFGYKEYEVRENTGDRVIEKVSFYDVDTQTFVEWFNMDDWDFSINAVRLSPDGKWLATPCSDGVVRLWGVPAN